MWTKFHYCHIMLLCCCYKVYKEHIKTTALAKGLTITVSISPQYLTAVRVLLVMTWKSAPLKGYASSDLHRWCCSQQNIHHSISRLFHTCHMHPARTCSHLSTEQSVNVWPASWGVLWKMPIKVHGAGLWTQAPLEDIGPSSQPCGVQSMLEEVFWVMLFSQKGAVTGPAGGLMPFYGPLQLSSYKERPPSISSMLLRLCWKTELTFLFHLGRWMVVPTGQNHVCHSVRQSRVEWLHSTSQD